MREVRPAGSAAACAEIVPGVLLRRVESASQVRAEPAHAHSSLAHSRGIASMHEHPSGSAPQAADVQGFAEGMALLKAAARPVTLHFVQAAADAEVDV